MIWAATDKAGLLRRSGFDPYIRTEAPDDCLGFISDVGWMTLNAWHDDVAGASLFFDTDPDPELAAEALALARRTAAANRLRLRWFSAAASIDLPLPDDLTVEGGGDWVWMSATAIRDEHPADWRLVELDDGADADEINAFGFSHNPRFEGQAGSGITRLWLGARDDAGALLGVGALHSTGAGFGHLAGLVVDERLRGRGLGRALLVALSRAAIAVDGLSTLSAYADNAAAIRLYEGVGYRLDHRFRSRRFAPEEPDPRS